MRKAGKASGRAFTDAMRQAWTKEKDLAAYLDYKFRANSCDGSAYVPVVAGGQVGLPLVGTYDSEADSSRMVVSYTTHRTITS